MARKKVLVTGIAGNVGGIVREYLGEVYDLTGLDLSPVEGMPSHVADLSDLDAIKPAFTGQEVVVHLGADTGGGPWDSVLQSNIVGTYNVMEASREAGVSRVVFASTNHVVGYHQGKVEPYNHILDGRLGEVRRPFPPITSEALRPDCNYAVSKAFGESLGSYYHDRHGISFIALRIGGVGMEPESYRKFTAGLAMWLSHRDAAQLIQRSIDAPPSVGYIIVYGMSNNSLRFHDIETAEKVLDYRPQDDAGEELDPDAPPQVPYRELAHPGDNTETST